MSPFYFVSLSGLMERGCLFSPLFLSEAHVRLTLPFSFFFFFFFFLWEGPDGPSILLFREGPGSPSLYKYVGRMSPHMPS
jgi:hypothetical protein